MAIDLDSIIAGSNSVDDVVAALQQEQQGTQKTAGQLQQLAEASKGTMSPLEWMKDKIGLSNINTDNYRNYYLKTQERGEEPMSKEEYMKAEKQKEQEGKSKSNSGSQSKKAQG
jgi:hypothetical protein